MRSRIPFSHVTSKMLHSASNSHLKALLGVLCTASSSDFRVNKCTSGWGETGARKSVCIFVSSAELSAAWRRKTLVKYVHSDIRRCWRTHTRVMQVSYCSRSFLLSWYLGWALIYGCNQVITRLVSRLINFYWRVAVSTANDVRVCARDDWGDEVFFRVHIKMMQKLSRVEIIQVHH